jgi:ElaB/YqjD/DUF883 family membrane-anchored ribosome-binding protein
MVVGSRIFAFPGNQGFHLAVMSLCNQRTEDVVEQGNIQGGLKINPNNGNSYSGGSMNGESTTKNAQDAMGHAQAAIGSAKDAVGTGIGNSKDALGSGIGSAKEALGSGVDAANTELDALKEQISKLAQTVSQLVQSQASSARDQVMSAVGTASESISQSASAAQGTLTFVEADVESRIKRNPWAAIAISGLLGVLIAKAIS